MAESGRGKVAIIGSGLIGRSWAMLFASVGYKVQLYDVKEPQLVAALEDIKKQLKDLEADGTLKGTLSAEEQFSLISVSTSFEDTIKGAHYLQECVPETLELKQEVFKKIDATVDYLNCTENIVLASSSSNMASSKFASDLKHRSRVLVAHPVNPPYYVPLVEIVPAPWTDPAVTEKTKAIMEEIGQAPVVLKKEVIGFALNRIQYSIINECWRLISDGVLDVKDVDTVMSEGLGMRYAFLGPLETAHLNAQGMEEYIEKYAKGIYDTSLSFGPIPDMRTSPIRGQVVADLEKKVPGDDLDTRRRWRDKGLRALAKIKQQLKKE